MSVESLGKSIIASAVSALYSAGNNLRAANASASSSQSKKDSATISEAARELAAMNSGTSSQEEATESASQKIQEQMSGLQ